MGFFFKDPPNRIKHSELEIEFKNYNLSQKQQKELLDHFEEHKRDHYSKLHIHEILHKMKDVSGDSFNTDQIHRVEKGLIGIIEDRVSAEKEKADIQKVEKPKAEPIDFSQYRNKNQQTPARIPQESKNSGVTTNEGEENRLDKAA